MMIHNESRVKSHRSLHTIIDNTQVIGVIEPSIAFTDTVEVRRMLSRTHKDHQHFIVTLLSDVNRAQDTEIVRPLAELAIRGEKLRFTVRHENQYPELHVSEEIVKRVFNIAMSYLGSYCS